MSLSSGNGSRSCCCCCYIILLAMFLLKNLLMSVPSLFTPPPHPHTPLAIWQIPDSLFLCVTLSYFQREKFWKFICRTLAALLQGVQRAGKRVGGLLRIFQYACPFPCFTFFSLFCSYLSFFYYFFAFCFDFVLLRFCCPALFIFFFLVFFCTQPAMAFFVA